MYLFKGLHVSLKEMFKAAEDNKRKGILICYIWVNKCDKCGSEIKLNDEEYSYSFSSSNESCTANEIKNDMEIFNKNYSIYENMYEENNKDFVYIGFNELENKDIYYYFKYDFTNKELCRICEYIFF